MSTILIAQRIETIIVEHLRVEAEKVIPCAKFEEDLGADSLDHVELIMAFEEEFDINIPDEVMVNIVTVQQAIDYVTKATAEASADA